MAARVFEACVQNQAIKNAFLVQGTKMSTEARLGIYPHGNLRIARIEALMLYFYPFRCGHFSQTNLVCVHSR